VIEKIFKMLISPIVGLGNIFAFILIPIVGCKLRTFRQEISIGELECTQNSCEFTIFKGKLTIGSIFFTDTHINISQYQCDIRKGVIDRDKVAVGYVDGQLVIIVSEQVRELFRAKCTLKDFERLEGFLYAK